MNKKAIIYTRVSTKEQGENGYSLRDQEANLRTWCAQKDIEVINHYQDDYSGKTFDRPQFKNLLEFIKRPPVKIDYVLFAKWDRFSRVAMDAHNMIYKLLKKSIEANAIEQWINHEMPEHKILLGIYVSVPESDNLRRGMNTKSGMRRARMEGRWMGKAPIGYENSIVNGKPQIIPGCVNLHNLIKKAFITVAEGIFSAETTYVKLHREGLKCHRSQFYNLLRSPVYAGYIHISAFNDEPEMMVRAIHEPIITLELWKQVQDVMNGRKRAMPKTNTITEHLPLRGHLLCPDCGKVLTGSGSIARNKTKHWYYHCQSGCKIRFRAEDANKAFIALLSKNSVPREVLKLYFKVLKDVCKSENNSYIKNLNNLETEIAKNRQRILNNADLFIDQAIERETFESNKARYNEAIETLNQQKQNIERRGTDIDQKIQYGLSLLEKPHQYYLNADLIAKREIIGSIYPEKLIFDGNTYRTTKNTIFELLNIRESAGNKKGLHSGLNVVQLSSPAWT
jgi:site-specific DNA recombinase